MCVYVYIYVQLHTHIMIQSDSRRKAGSNFLAPKYFTYVQPCIHMYMHITTIQLHIKSYEKQTRTRNENNNEMKIKVGNCTQIYRRNTVEKAQHKAPTKGRNMPTRTHSYDSHTIFGIFKWPSHGSESNQNEISRPRNVTHSTVRQFSTPRPTPAHTCGAYISAVMSKDLHPHTYECINGCLLSQSHDATPPNA